MANPRRGPLLLLLLVPCMAGGLFLLPGILPPGPVDVLDSLREPEATAAAPVSIDEETSEETPAWTGRILAGRVLAAVGDAPIAGAAVAAVERPDVRHPKSGPEVRTDREGRFSVRLPEKLPGLSVDADGYTPVLVPVPDHAGDVEIRLDRRGEIHGRVVTASEGEPVPGAVIRVAEVVRGFGHDSLGATRSATSDSEGHFRVRDVPAGKAAVYVRGGGWASTGLAQFTVWASCRHLVLVESGGVRDLVLRVEPSARIPGVVVDEDGRPVAKAEVDVWTKGWVPSPGSVHTRADGRFELEDLVPGAPHTVEAMGKGRPSGRVDSIRLDPGESRDIRVRMPVTRWVTVRVVERDSGRAIEGATVTTGGREPEVRTDARGLARLGPYADRTLELDVEHPDHILLPDSIKVETAGEGEVRVALARGLEITGRALLPDGALLAEGEISCHTSRHSPATFSGAGFRLRGLPPGWHEIRVSSLRGAWEGQFVGEIEAEAGETDVIVRLAWEEPVRVPPEEDTIVVIVLDGAGRPVPRATARVIPDEKGGGGADVEFGRVDVKASLGGKTFRVEILDARSAAGLPLPLAAVLTEPFPIETREVTIHLPPEQSISGAVRDAEGKGVAGVVVRARPAESGPWTAAYRETLTDPDGGFRLGGLRSGRHVVSIECPSGFRVDEEGVEAEAGARDVVLTIERIPVNFFTVVDAEGRPVPGVKVEACRETPESETTRCEWSGPEGRTDSAGVVRLTGLDPVATYLVRAQPPEDRLDLLYTPCWGSKPGATVVLRKGFQVTAVVDGAGEHGIADLVVFGRSLEEDSWIEGVRIGPATYRLGPFPAGPVGLIVYAREDVSDPASWGGSETVVPAGTEGARIPYRPSRSLVVRVRDWPAGADEVRGSLCPGGPIDAIRSVEAGPDGVFHFSGLPPARTFTFFAGPFSDGRHAHRMGIPADAGEVVLPLVSGGTITGRMLLPATGRLPDVYATGRGWEIGAEVAADGSFTIRGVPEGPVRVEAQGCVEHEGQHRHFSGEVEAKAGESVTLAVEIR